MNAVIRRQYGSPEVLSLAQLAKPTPADDEVLIRVRASSINAYDWRIMRGDPFLVRLSCGLFKPKSTRLGADVAGTVEAVGKNVQDMCVGDAVFGCLADGNGNCAFSEYVCAKPSILAPKPEAVTFEMVATLPMAAVTALQGLRDAGQIKAGQRVLINGASGGVGTFAVQIAKAFGAEVTGVCSARNLDMVQHIGADHVIDYSREDFAQGDQQYDLILDNVANHTLAEFRRALRPNGRCVVVGFSTLAHVARVMLFGSRATKENKKIVMLMADNTKQEDLLFLAGLLENGKVTPVVDGCYPLCDIGKAFRYFEQEHAKGKVVITVS